MTTTARCSSRFGSITPKLHRKALPVAVITEDDLKLHLRIPPITPIKTRFSGMPAVGMPLVRADKIRPTSIRNATPAGSATWPKLLEGDAVHANVSAALADISGPYIYRRCILSHAPGHAKGTGTFQPRSSEITACACKKLSVAPMHYCPLGLPFPLGQWTAVICHNRTAVGYDAWCSQNL